MIFAMGVFSLLLIVLTAPVAAQDGVQIDFPPPVYDVSGTVQVTGTVNPANLQSFFLEVAIFGQATPQWIPVTLPNTAPVTNGILGSWVTTLLPDGVYQLRLRVVLTTGEQLFETVGPIRVGNQLVRAEGDTTPDVQIVTAPPVENVPPPQEVAPPPPENAVVGRPNPVNRLPIAVGGQVTSFSDNTIAAMRSAGMTWMKWQVPFVIGEDSLVEVARDRINFAHENGFFVLLSITGEVSELAALGDDYYPVFAEFLGRVAAFQPDAIEVWNEMNIDREWPTGRIDPRAYADMLQQAFNAIKAVDPNIMVITGALAPTGAEGAFGLDRVWNDDRYYLGMANAGVTNFADCIGVHYNEGIIPPQQQGGDPRDSYPTRFFPLMLNRAAFPFRNSDIPLCFTELGYLTPEGYGPLPGGFAWAANTSIQEQATWLRDAISLAANDGRVELIIVFNVDFERYDDDPQAGYAIIRADGSCPACQAIASLQQ